MCFSNGKVLLSEAKLMQNFSYRERILLLSLMHETDFLISTLALGRAGGFDSRGKHVLMEISLMDNGMETMRKIWNLLYCRRSSFHQHDELPNQSRGAFCALRVRGKDFHLSFFIRFGDETGFFVVGVGGWIREKNHPEYVISCNLKSAKVKLNFRRGHAGGLDGLLVGAVRRTDWNSWGWGVSTIVTKIVNKIRDFQGNF